ncbi:MAG: DUF3300 domain-containing protein [Rhodobacteraceae bacterium]|nr:DUF3300 domain-containing protein [Paracoccaceae bacterium]
MDSFMRPASVLRSGVTAVAVLAAGIAVAQTDAPDPGDSAAPPPDAAADQAASGDEAGDALLTQAELERLVAPVALYPDTLLIQILVGATQPLDVVKAERFLEDNVGRDASELKPEIEAQDWDPSVAVLATAFPEVVSNMATHIEWTETMGDAMLAQSDDVLNAVQVMRQEAINSGALLSGPEQTVETEPAADGSDVVVITPTNPQTVYVPQYSAQQVYPQTYGLDVADVLVGGAVAFGTVALIDAIFDDDDDWDRYWGCRNCGGWDGGPIVRNPDIDIDVDGDINFGDRDLSIDRDKIAWKPDARDRAEARDKITARRDAGGAGLHFDQATGRSDALRDKLARQTGTADISRGDAVAGLAAGAGAAAIGAGRIDRPKIDRGDGAAQARAAAIRDTRAPSGGTLRDKAGAGAGGGDLRDKAAAKGGGDLRDKAAAKGGGGDLRAKAAAKGGGNGDLRAKAAAKKPSVAKKPGAATKPAALKADSAKIKKPKGQALSKNASASRTKAATNRGKKVSGKHKAKRR